MKRSLALILGAVALAAEAKAPPADPARDLAELSRTSPALAVQWSRDQRQVEALLRLSEPSPGPSADLRARAFLSRWPGLYPAGAELSLLGESTAAGRTVVRYQQELLGLPIAGRQLNVTLEGERVVGVVGGLARPAKVLRARIDAAQAARLAVKAVFGADRASSAAVKGRQWMLDGERAVEVYRVSVLRRPVVEELEVLVDGAGGQVIGMSDKVIR